MESINESIERFLNCGSGNNQYPSGSLDCTGYGNGSPCGDCSADGFIGYGGWPCCNRPNGEGDETCNGYGSGGCPEYDEEDYDGSGMGSLGGDGWGNGDQFQYGITMFAGQIGYYIDTTPTLIFIIHFNKDGGYAKGSIIKDDLSLKPCYIVKYRNCFAYGNTLHEAVIYALAKWRECETTRLNKKAISEFVQSHPQFIDGEQAQYSFTDLFYWHHKLTDSCESGRLDFCKRHDFTEYDYFTIEEFVNLTKYAYGSDIIYDVAREYGILLY